MSTTAEIRAKLQELQSVAEQLEFDASQRTAQLRAVERYTEAFLGELDTQPVYMPDVVDPEAAQALQLEEQPVGIDTALTLLKQHVDNSGFNNGSQRFFAFIPSGGLYPSALGDFAAAVTNRYAGVQFSAPGVTRLECALLRWLADTMGYPDSAAGDLTSGGSIAALSAIVAARQAFDIKSKDVDHTVVYITALTHHTFLKAMRIAGLAECPVRTVPIDSAYRMDVNALERSITADAESGLVPWMIVATAGTTDIGSIDPLEAIADVAQRHGLWMHVDAAYGGGFALCAEGKARLHGIERSASLILDPHKGLFLPWGSGVVLVRNGETLYEAYSHPRGSYMQDLPADTLGQDRSASDRSPELTRPFRGLRLWLPLKVMGLAPFRAALEEKLLLAQYFYERISAMEGFLVGPSPDLSVVIFRYAPEYGDGNEFNRQLADELRRDGRVLLSTTMIDGKFGLRMAVLGYNTHLDDVDLALELLQKKAAQLTQST